MNTNKQTEQIAVIERDRQGKVVRIYVKPVPWNERVSEPVTR